VNTLLLGFVIPEGQYSKEFESTISSPLKGTIENLTAFYLPANYDVCEI
jgi:hypothetical protein